MSTPRIRGILPFSVEANQNADRVGTDGPDRSGSTLALLVAGILADDVDLPPAANDLAVLADPLHAGSNLHRTSYSLSHQQQSRTPRRNPCHGSGRRVVRLILWPNLPDFGPNSANIHECQTNSQVRTENPMGKTRGERGDAIPSRSAGVGARPSFNH